LFIFARQDGPGIEAGNQAVDHAPTDTRRILVVDDERIQRMIVTREVRSLGFEADGAATLEEASACLARQAYDVVLLDLSLGETEGISLLQALRHGVGDPAVIFISGLDDRVRTASLRLAASLGLRVAGAIRKPVTRDELMHLLQSLPERTTIASQGPIPVPTAEELAEALQWERITTQFQPKVSLTDGHVVGMEALARWPLPTKVLVPPDVFIPLAEANGLIVPLTMRILRQALEACRHWRRAYPGCSVAVNISPLVLVDPTLPEEIERMLRDTGLGPGALIAEITESTVIANPLVAAEILTRLRIKGISLSIDDFGTGHSSLLGLLRLPFSELKIDRSFVSNCDTDAEAWKIARATISMARELGLTVVAEGIERQEIADMLRGAGCHIGQGWLYAHAMDERALYAWLAAHQPVPA
jgi:EAL domain-containing protein (putative c-di-GMP-specific phosphodiesterase class I)